MLARTMKMAFWVSYDHVGKLLLANVIWALGITLPGAVALSALNAPSPGLALALAAPFLFLALGVVGPVLTAGLAHMTKILIDSGDGALSDMLDGVKLYWKRAIGVGVALFSAGCVLGTSVWFYATQMSAQYAWLGFGASTVALWLLLFVLLCAVLVMPTLVQKRGGVLATLKLTALIVLDNPLFLVGVGLQWVALLVLSVVMLPVFFGFYGALCVVISSCAYEMLDRRYTAERAAADDGGTVRAPRRDEDDDYLNRGVRDFLFPWKS